MKSILVGLAIAIAIAPLTANAIERIDRNDRIAQIKHIDYGMYRSYRDDFKRIPLDFSVKVWRQDHVKSVTFLCDRITHWGSQAYLTAENFHRQIRAQEIKEDINLTIQACALAMEHIAKSRPKKR